MPLNNGTAFLLQTWSTLLKHSPIFKITGSPAFKLNEQQYAALNEIFKKMEAEESTDYIYKGDLIRNYINLIVHEALRMVPAENFIQHNNALFRVSSSFLGLLERQFPIESPQSPLLLKSAKDYAQRLYVHPNYLNRAVKRVTGKSTANHIADRIILEALAMLQHTDWNIVDIAYGHGFEYTTYSTISLKK